MPTLLTPTLIVYMSKHGTTTKVVELIKNYFPANQVTAINLSKERHPNVLDYKNVIIGCSIHMGMIPQRMKDFCEENREILLSKRLGLFLCCMYENEKAETQFSNAFSFDLRKHAKSTGLLGSELYFDKMNFVERIITKKVTGVKNNVSNINYNAINQFVAEYSS